MGPTVVAAIIAGSISLFTLIMTVGAQIYGVNKTSGDTRETLKTQREQLEGAFEAQSEQLKSTLKEQSEQLKRTLDQERDRTLNERFSTAADQLGSDKPPAVRLAGVYAMAGLADDWHENRQTCVDVLCAYLRMPYKRNPGEGAREPERLGFRADREVRHTVIRVITARLRDDAKVSWRGYDLDFTGVVFDGGDFSHARFSAGKVSFDHAVFSEGSIDFGFVEFSGGSVSFGNTEFSGAEIRFDYSAFSGGIVEFPFAKFYSGKVSFDHVKFLKLGPTFLFAKFSGGKVSFWGAESLTGFHSTMQIFLMVQSISVMQRSPPV